MTAPRALVVGEALIDVVHRRDGSVESHPGGSPLNVAIGLARLGREAHLLTWIGDDDAGAALTEHLGASGVHLAPGSDGAARSSTAVATLDESGAATYEFDIDWQLPAGAVTPDPVVVHTGSIAAVLEPGADAVLELVRAHRASASITYDPNMRPALMGSAAAAAERVEPVLDAADVVKVSDEDLHWLHPDADPVTTATRWADAGPGLVVVTRGGAGAVAVRPGGTALEVPGVPVAVADTVGAGDTFSGVLIDALLALGVHGRDAAEALAALTDRDLLEVVTTAAVGAAINVSRPGADPPTRAELSSALGVDREAGQE